MFSQKLSKMESFFRKKYKNGIHFPQKLLKNGIHFHSFCGNWIPFAKTIKMESILSSKREQSSTIVHFSHRFTLIL